MHVHKDVPILPLVGLLLCGPLLFVWLFQGDIPAYREGVLAVLLSFASILPALGIYVASRLKRIQIVLFCFLVILAGFEANEGITPTSQLNHEGSDLVFLVLHTAYFLLAVAVVLAVNGWHAIKRRIGGG